MTSRKRSHRLRRAKRSSVPWNVGLPDELLRHLFRMLAPEDLLRGARGVNQAWRRMALDPLLWRNYELPVIGPFATLALNILPCAKSLRVSNATVAHAVSTNCAVEELQVWFSSSNVHLGSAQRVVRRQVELGRLRSVKLLSVSRVDAQELIEILIHSSIIEDLGLDLEIGNADGLDAPLRGELATLKRLSYFGLSDDVLLESLLEQHAPTLECVLVWNSFPNTFGDRVLQLLSTCPQLRELRLEVHRPPPTPAVREYLQGPGLKLTELTVVTEEYVEDLRALAASGLAAVRKLCIGKFVDVSMLPGLRHLHTLEVLCFLSTDGLLDAISPNMVANLRLLDLRGGVVCKETHCNLPPVHSLVWRCSRLHVRVRVMPTGQHLCWGADCPCCNSGMHQDLPGILDYGLFGHDPAEACDLEAHTQEGSSVWERAIPPILPPELEALEALLG